MDQFDRCPLHVLLHLQIDAEFLRTVERKNRGEVCAHANAGVCTVSVLVGSLCGELTFGCVGFTTLFWMVIFLIST